MTRHKITIRTAERLSRMAYEMELLSERLRAEGYALQAGTTRDAAVLLGRAGDSLRNKLSNRNAMTRKQLPTRVP